MQSFPYFSPDPACAAMLRAARVIMSTTKCDFATAVHDAQCALAALADPVPAVEEERAPALM